MLSPPQRWACPPKTVPRRFNRQRLLQAMELDDLHNTQRSPAMPSDPRVEELLDKLMDSGGTPEEVCRTCPELLAQVRAGWARVRAVQADLEVLFPPASSTVSAATPQTIE